MVKNIFYDWQYFLYTRFGVLDRHYPTGELNVILKVDQIAFCLGFKNTPNKTITLHVMAVKSRKSNQIAVFCNCKKKM